LRELIRFEGEGYAQSGLEASGALDGLNYGKSLEEEEWERILELFF
jgi:hypothetical protein